MVIFARDIFKRGYLLGITNYIWLKGFVFLGKNTLETMANIVKVYVCWFLYI